MIDGKKGDPYLKYHSLLNGSQAQVRNQMTQETIATGASAAPTQYVEVNGHKTAYRVVGEGAPIVLCNRFRGTLDTWDPLFIDSLAAQGFKVFTFDYAGLGLSAGEKTYDAGALAQNTIGFIGALELENVVIGGWSLGGVTAQIVMAMASDNISHGVLLGATPPGHLVKDPEPHFFELASKEENDFDDFAAIFFEPADQGSVGSAQRAIGRIMQRQDDLCPSVPADWAIDQLGREPQNPMFPSEDVLNFLKNTNIPILHIGGDHDIIFPVENWYALNGLLPTMHLITYPRAGHGPFMQYPENAATQIGAFIASTTKA